VNLPDCVIEPHGAAANVGASRAWLLLMNSSHRLWSARPSGCFIIRPSLVESGFGIPSEDAACVLSTPGRWLWPATARLPTKQTFASCSCTSHSWGYGYPMHPNSYLNAPSPCVMGDKIQGETCDDWAVSMTTTVGTLYLTPAATCNRRWGRVIHPTLRRLQCLQQSAIEMI
jgi:hypothetical protein